MNNLTLESSSKLLQQEFDKYLKDPFSTDDKLLQEIFMFLRNYTQEGTHILKQRSLALELIRKTYINYDLWDIGS